MKNVICILGIITFALGVQAKPPYHGTVWVDPDIITDEDPTSFKNLVKSGKGKRKMHDRRVNGWVTLKAHLFTAFFDDQKQTIEVQVNPEFDKYAAFKEANKYLKVIGQIPVSLRKDVQTVWTHKGDRLFGGGNNNLQIHTAQGEKYIIKGLLAEVFIHEATHTSLDRYYRNNKQWLAAQKKDREFISEYAQKHPGREDLAESFPLYLALRYKPDRIDAKTRELITKTIPNRIFFFDTLKLNMHPVK